MTGARGQASGVSQGRGLVFRVLSLVTSFCSTGSPGAEAVAVAFGPMLLLDGLKPSNAAGFSPSLRCPSVGSVIEAADSASSSDASFSDAIMQAAVTKCPECRCGGLPSIASESGRRYSPQAKSISREQTMKAAIAILLTMVFGSS